MSGCSIERDWKRMRHAALVDPYRARVGAGMTAAREEMRAMAGAREVCWRRGICGPRCNRFDFQGQTRVVTHECNGRDERADVVALEGIRGDVSSPFYPLFGWVALV